MIRLTTDAISYDEVIESVRGNPANGAVVSFIGSLRDLSAEGKPLRHGDCELDAAGVEPQLQELAAEVCDKYNVSAVSIAHRYGRIAVGETILIVAVAAAHRPEAFAACQHLIDRVKDMHRLVEFV